MRTRAVPTVALVLLLAGRAPAADDPADLLKYIPPQANAVAVVNVAFLLSSPRAEREGWAKRDHLEYLAGAVPVHPSVERMVLARHLDPTKPGHGPMVGVLPTTVKIDIDKLAATVGGEPTTVAGGPAVATRNGTLLIPLAPQVLGVARTDTRQDAARWVRFARTSTESPLSKYMYAAVYGFAKRHHIAIAVDAEELFESGQTKEAIAHAAAVSADPGADQAGHFFAGLRGVLLLVDVTDTGLTAHVRIAGGSTLGLKPNIVRAAVVGVLERNGAMLDNLKGAKETIEEGGVVLTFALGDAELARIMGLFLPPLPPTSPADVLAVSPTAVNPQATRRYYKAATTALDDLRRRYKKAEDYDKTALWHDSAANTLEGLSVTGVDPKMVEFGAGTASRLRAIADSLRGVPVQVAALEGEGYAVGYLPRAAGWVPGRGIRLNPWLGAGVQSLNTNLPEIRRKEAEAVKKDEAARAKLWQEIDQKQAEIERGLSGSR